jgi:hypothetical protein
MAELKDWMKCLKQEVKNLKLISAFKQRLGG